MTALPLGADAAGVVAPGTWAGAVPALGDVSARAPLSGPTSPGAAWMVGVAVIPSAGGTSDFRPHAMARSNTTPRVRRERTVIGRNDGSVAAEGEGRIGYRTTGTGYAERKAWR